MRCSCSARASRSIRDVGNNGMYADTALRAAIEQGWMPGPTIIPSGLIISTTGGQFQPTPEMYKQHNIVYPGVPRSQHARRDRQGGAREPAVRREDDQDLRGLQAVGLLRRGHQAVHHRGGEGRRQGRWARADDGGRAACDRRRHPRHLARPAADAGAARADGKEEHLPRQHRHAVHPVSRLGRGAEAGSRSSSRARGRKGCRSRSRPTWTTGTSG